MDNTLTGFRSLSWTPSPSTQRPFCHRTGICRFRFSQLGVCKSSAGGTRNAKAVTATNRRRGEPDLGRFPEGRAFVIQEQTISVNRRGGLPVQFVIQNNNFDKLQEVLPKFLEAANNSPVLQGVDVDLKFNKPELKVRINRLKLLSWDHVQVYRKTLQLAYSNLRFGYFTKDGNSISDRTSSPGGPGRSGPTSSDSMYEPLGQLISIDNVVSIEESTTPPAL